MAAEPAYTKAPAYQYYPDNFEQGTATFTLAEVGAYQRLLNYQWTNGSIPGDSVKALSLILRCTQATAKAIWKQIAGKFVRGDNGEWRNARMERERLKQVEYRERQANRGKASAAAKANRKATDVPTSVPTPVEPALQPEPQPNVNSSSPSSSSFSSTSSKNDDVPRVSRVASAPVIMSPARYEKLQQTHAFVGSRLKVPNVLHVELRDKLGGLNAESRLQAWYLELNTAADEIGEPIPDVFVWLRPKFIEWAQQFVMDLDREKFIREMNSRGR